MEKHTRDPWWDRFFRGPWLTVQQSGYPADRTSAEAAFVIDTLALAPGARVLDVPCGEGRHAIALAQRGLCTTGVDFNRHAIALARSRAAEQGVAPTFLEADAREFPLDDGPYDAAICFYGSFGYFDDSDNLRFAARVASALRTGGQFLIDTQVLETVLPRFSQRQWWWSSPAQDVLVAEDRSFDVATSRIEGVFHFHGDGVHASAPFSIRLYSVRELQDLLRCAGFTRFRAVETGSGAPFQVGAQRLSLIAEK